MATQVTIQTTDGRVVNAVSYRMEGSMPPSGPSVPASPLPFNGGMYHVQTVNGWVDIPANQVAFISLNPGAFT